MSVSVMQLDRPHAYETTTALAIDAERYVEIRSAFLAHMAEYGAHIVKPHLSDLLQKPTQA